MTDTESLSLATFAEELATDIAKPAGATWHCVSAGLTVHAADISNHHRYSAATSRVLEVGDELVIDDVVLEASRDALGHSVFEALDDESQVENWGVVMLRQGTLASNPALLAQLEADREAEASQRRQERVLDRHRYGKRTGE